MITPGDVCPGSSTNPRAGVNAEQWLVQRVSADPAILGLGDLDLERVLPSRRSGRVSLLLQDPAELSRWVVELQFGLTDDRHVIRVVEHWAAERRRHPRSRCFAALVAEHIAPRYLNILHLISRTVPVALMEMHISEAAGTTSLRFAPVGLRLR